MKADEHTAETHTTKALEEFVLLARGGNTAPGVTVGLTQCGAQVSVPIVLGDTPITNATGRGPASIAAVAGVQATPHAPPCDGVGSRRRHRGPARHLHHSGSRT